MKNSDNSPPFSWLQLFGVTLLLVALAASAVWFFYSSGYLLYYGDAQAHLNISRSLIDSRTPGYDQLGTVWLPVLHVICLPFVGNTELWHSGLAAAFPVATCFVIAGVCLYVCGQQVYRSSLAAFVALLCFVLNPNVLYLATITMTEIVFIAGLSICLLALIRFRKTQNHFYILIAIVASWWMSLTRYDGWFLIPFIALLLAVSAQRRKFFIFLFTGAAAALAPIYWMAHNWWETSNPLDFYNGPYSAVAIQAHRTYPGLHNWPQAIHYYWEAGRDCCGSALLFLGLLGLFVAIFKRFWLPAIFLSLTPLFYVWSIHSSWTPIHVPSLWPFSYYNSRYGIAVTVVAAFSAGALVTLFPRWLKRFAFVIPLIAVLPWFINPTQNHWICWKESEQNSISRRAWTADAAAYLGSRLHSGDGVLMESSTGDVSGILCKAGIPLKESLSVGNGPIFFANTMPNGLVHQTKWAVAQDGDKISKLLAQANWYRIVKVISVKGAPDLLIYERVN